MKDAVNASDYRRVGLSIVTKTVTCIQAKNRNAGGTSQNSRIS